MPQILPAGTDTNPFVHKGNGPGGRLLSTPGCLSRPTGASAGEPAPQQANRCLSRRTGASAGEPVPQQVCTHGDVKPRVPNLVNCAAGRRATLLNRLDSDGSCH